MTSKFSIQPRSSVGSRLTACAALGLAFGFSGCDGSSGGSTGSQTQIARPTLQAVDYGRLVDVYASQRIDPANSDRRDSRNRRPVLIERNVLINSQVENEPLFDAIGGERPTADFRFMPFNAEVGHEELLILWDNGDPIEGQRFQTAFLEATSNLASVPASFRDQNVATRPIPVVPRNAAIRLRFDGNLGVDSAFFDANPGVVQVLRFLDDPNVVSPQAAFVPATFRVLAKQDSLILDTTVIGGEAVGRQSSAGLAPSADQQSANFRIAIPTSGIVSRLLNVDTDSVPELNGVDAQGNPSVIRDFRSGNFRDGRVGALSDETRPMLVGQFAMGIVEVDAANNVLVVNKRGNLVAMRGRIPFVDGAIDPTNRLPGGRSTVPTIGSTQTREPLAAGDIIQQTVLSSAGEPVTVRAEIIENLDVGSEIGDSRFAAPGLTATGDDGGDLPVARLRVAGVTATDSAGNPVMFTADAAGSPEGADCVARVRYYENVPYSGEFGIAASVSDTSRRALFVPVDPPPTPGGQPISTDTVRFVSPMVSLGLQFSEPMDLASLDTARDFVYSTEDVDVSKILASLGSPKSAGLSLLPSRIVDERADGTRLKLLTPLGHNHEAGSQELYWMHAIVSGVRDLTGNTLDLFDRRAPGTTDISFRRGGSVVTEAVEVPIQSFSVQFEMLADAPANRIGTKYYRFEAADEDGTKPGSVDMFGQFRILDGQLVGAATTRFSANCDDISLSTVTRNDRGECTFQNAQLGGVRPLYAWSGVPINTRTPPNIPTIFQPPTGAQNFGGIAEPHIRRGSRMQLTYREDDFGLSYHDANQLNVDVEQLSWAPWNDQPAYFDTFDRYTILLGHSNKRPDFLHYLSFPPVVPPAPPPPPTCELDCASLFSGLSEVFDQNVLEGTQMKRVVDEVTYVVNPGQAFRGGAAGVKYVPYARFQQTYTWRDSRLVTWDMTEDRVIGLGGAQDALTAVPAGDRTASVSSPWTPDLVDQNVDGLPHDPTLGLFTDFVRDIGDFLGDRTKDHDPIALPLLVEFRVAPDDTVSSATSGNLFWFGTVGPQFSEATGPGGYYNRGVAYNTITNDMNHVACQFIPDPFFRVHSSGGIDLLDGSDRLIYPNDNPRAIGGLIKDMGIGRLPHDGLTSVGPGDGHVYWSQIDFVRRVSLVTFGFFDTKQPNRHDLVGQDPAIPALPPTTAGRPNFDGTDLEVRDIVVTLDPPVQAGGATVQVEVRGVDRIGLTAPTLYDPLTQDRPDLRGNLLNPNYAMEAYRYAQASTTFAGAGTPRVDAAGFTPYVQLQDIDTIRDSRTGVLPRYLNVRLTMTNNTAATPAVSPALRNMSIAYRLSPLN